MEAKTAPAATGQLLGSRVWRVNWYRYDDYYYAVLFLLLILFSFVGEPYGAGVYGAEGVGRNHVSILQGSSRLCNGHSTSPKPQ